MIPFPRWKQPVEGSGRRRRAEGTERWEARGLELGDCRVFGGGLVTGAAFKLLMSGKCS